MLASLYAEPRLEPIFRIVDWAYATPTSLHVRNPSGGSTVLSSENGTRQELSFRGDKSALNFSEATLHQETLDFAHEHRIPTKRTITILGAPMGSDAEAVQALAVAELTVSSTRKCYWRSPTISCAWLRFPS